MRRRTRFAPIRPRPIIASCISGSFLVDRSGYRRPAARSCRARRGVAMARMAGIVRWDEGPFAPPLDQPPAVEALEVVVVGTQAVEQVEHGEMRRCPVDPV